MTYVYSILAKNMDWKEMLKASKMARIELYKDHKTMSFLSKFLNGEIDELKPIYDPKVGYHYPIVEAFFDGALEAETFLNKLYSIGVLKRQLYDKIIYCPKCSSTSISIHYCCPYCKSFDIEKSSLIEHIKCGYIDVEENFRKEDKYVCSKCNEELKKRDVDYIKAGIWCTCRDCNKSFDIPISNHFCRDCHTNFTFEEILFKNVYSYRLSKEVKEEAALGWFLVAPIQSFLVKKGFKVKSPGSVDGKSGINHSFDIVAYNEENMQEVIVIDLATSFDGVVSEEPVIALFAKTFDVSPSRAYLIVIPKLSENGKKIAELYKIQAVEGKNEKEAMEALKERMK